MSSLSHEELMTPSQISRFYNENVTYDNSNIRFWHYRTVDETLSDGVGVCHDAGRFFYEQLRRIGYQAKRYFMSINVPDEKKQEYDDENHSIVTFMRDGFYYHIEGTWWSLYGIHGPFRSINALLRNIDHLYKTVWQSDPTNPAPLGLSFTFHEFNEEALDARLKIEEPIGINEFVSIVKGEQIDIYKHDIELHDHKFKEVLIIIDDNPKAEIHSRALRSLCDSKQISNVVLHSDEEIDLDNYRVRYTIEVGVQRYTLRIPLDDKRKEFEIIDIDVKEADLEKPVIETVYQESKGETLVKRTLKWFPDYEEAMHRHKPVAKLLLETMYLM